MKKWNFIFCFVSSVLLCFSFSACQKTEELQSIELSQSELDMEIGDTVRLSVSVTGNSHDVILSWSSSNPAVVTVDDGLVTAVSSGNAEISVSCGDVSDVCAVTVASGSGVSPDIESVELDMDKCTMVKGEKLKLTATIEPEEAAEGIEIQWSSSNESVAVVDDEGLVSALAVGSVTITAKAGDVYDECEVNVVEKSVEDIILSEVDIELTVGQTHTLTATVMPEGLGDVVLEWATSDGNVAVVDNEGTVTAVSAGKAIITVTCQSVTSECNVTVAAVQLPAPQIGDFYYSDGTWSSDLDDAKQLVGVVFYAGDPAQDDGILKNDYPECTHGLVISLQRQKGPWQAGYSNYNDHVDVWVQENLSGYESLLGGMNGTSADDNLNEMLGYQYTKAIKAFNEDPSHANCQVDVVSGLSSFEAETPAPSSSTGWYLPSIKEVTLMFYGEYEGNIYDICDEAPNRDVINASLQKISGADLIGDDDTYYWSSSETYANSPAQAYSMYAMFPMISPWLKTSEGAYFYILAF